MKPGEIPVELAEVGDAPYIVFVCQDDNHREQFMTAADYELTGHRWHPSACTGAGGRWSALKAVTVSYPPGARSGAHHHAKSAFIMAYVISGATRSHRR